MNPSYSRQYRQRSRTFLSLLSVVLSSSLGVDPALAQTWEIEVVEYGKQIDGMTDRCLRIDEAGRPHLAYGQDHLYYAFHDGTSWHYEVADWSQDVGWSASLALDASGWPHISYYDGTNSLDASGWPHISYYDGTNSDLKYAWRDASGWHLETIDSTGSVGFYTSLSLDTSGNPHISYYDHTNHDLKYACEDAEGWHVETIDSDGHVGWYTSLALDVSGNPHISYHDYTNGYLKHARRDSTVWHLETVDSAGDGSWYTSLALDVSPLSWTPWAMHTSATSAGTAPPII
ncbi:MAG: hypothetical protein MUE60_00600 [Candidatus Eisenbacteria bacterium]|nr:hypothetical protein [Candidatus Eisenbacteria bacterium]